MTYEPVPKLILCMRFEHFAKFSLAISFWPEISTPSDFFVTRSYLSTKYRNCNHVCKHFGDQLTSVSSFIYYTFLSAREKTPQKRHVSFLQTFFASHTSGHFFVTRSFQ